MIDSTSPEFIELEKIARQHALHELKAQGLDISRMSDMEKAAFEVGLSSGIHSSLLAVVGTLM